MADPADRPGEGTKQLNKLQGFKVLPGRGKVNVVGAWYAAGTGLLAGQDEADAEGSHGKEVGADISTA
jgi:hypothetical protein